ncbi:MAG: L,D-transpeptidase family protein [Burkholderiaceae bacterium]|nr:MAG: hypothetical protein CBC60_03165 [Betaproteobacteria bacterium TMED100]|tara:strand:- start:1886 stop:2422 length:537 start_codon:yes stop_codon:yes gene_type:complete
MSIYHILIEISIQKLTVYKSTDKNWLENDDRWNTNIYLDPVFSTSVSTAANGVGEQYNSFKTPLGKHKIKAKIGQNYPIESVFVGRRATGEVWNESLSKQYPNRDWILTRILWLSGLEKGKNRFGCVDTMKRYVYIHGSPPSVKMGTVGSKGCIRMTGKDIVTLFDIVPNGTTVNLKL